MTANDDHERPQASVESALASGPFEELIRTSEPPLRHPADFIRNLWHDIRRSRPLALELAKRDLRVQYRQPVLGVAAVMLPPLALSAVGLGFREAGLLTVDTVAIPYGLFLFTGIVLWITFLDALNAPIHGMMIDQSLVARTNAPPEAIVLGRLLHLAANLGMRIILLALAAVWYGISIPLTVWLAPIGLVGLIALGTSVGLMLTPINLIYRDVSRLLMIATTFWLFLSPVYFPMPDSGIISHIMQWNPVAPLLSGTRSVILTGEFEHPGRELALIAGTLLLVVVCWIYVRVALPIVVERTND